MTYNYRELNSTVNIDNLDKDLEARDEYLRYVNDNFLKCDNYLDIHSQNKIDTILYEHTGASYSYDLDFMVLDSFERFKYLVDNRYYSNFFKYYKEEDVISLIHDIYLQRFEFKSYMSAFTFYNDYALKSDDKKTYYEHYEDAIVGLSLYLAKTNINLAREFALTLIKQEYQPATPTFMNARKKKRGEMISCFLLDIDDSLNSIMYQISQAAQLSKIGGGVALNLSKLRSRGESIKNISNATKGVVPVMKLLENTFNYVDQMGQRKGAGVAYLNIFHYDIKEFLDTKKINADEKSRIQTLSLGVIIPNKFMELCKDNKDINMFAPYSIYKLYGKHLDDMNMDEMYDELSNHPEVIKHSMNARDLLNLISEVQFESGYPYLMFRDTANNINPLKGLESITMTNLCCFTGDTEVKTKEYGLISFNNLIKKKIDKVTVYSAKQLEQPKRYYEEDQIEYHETTWEFEEKSAKVLSTGRKQIIKVILNNGDMIKCTPEHKLALLNGGYVEAQYSLGKILKNESIYDNSSMVKQLIFDDENEYPVYCLEVEDNHNFVISGGTSNYLVHNCEIFQSQKTSIINNDNEENELGYDVNCILGSLNIVNIMDNKSIKESVYTAIQMLTQVSDSSNINNAPTVKKANELFHSIGLGAMNLHGYLTKNMIPYESEEAKDFCNVLFMMINYYSLEKSMLIAKDKESYFYGFEKSEYKNGNYFNQYIQDDIIPITEKISNIFNNIYIPTKDDWIRLKNNIQEYGLYHSYRLAIAPTGNISYLQNSTPSIMPITQHIEPRISNDKVTYFPMPFLTRDNTLFYKLAYNMDMTKMIDLVSVIQKHVDQGISTTLFITSDYSTRDLQKLYIHAYKQGLKSLYYTRVKNISVIDECLACAI